MLGLTESSDRSSASQVTFAPLLHAIWSGLTCSKVYHSSPVLLFGQMQERFALPGPFPKIMNG